MKHLFKKVQQQFEANLPFVLFKKPNINQVTAYLQDDKTLYECQNLDQNGFVFANFKGDKTYIIPENHAQIITENFEIETIFIKKNNFQNPKKEVQDNFENLIHQGIQAIKEQKFKKVVLSRKEEIALQDFNLIATFSRLANHYPNTFAYCFYHPKIGLWLGATPEQLVKIQDQNFETIALAGTQKSNDLEVIWQAKEIEEQQFVTDYIVEKIKKRTSNLRISKPYSTKAGALWHLKTEISGKINPDYNAQSIVRLLHPTPAVCGYPQEAAQQFINNYENYDRAFYTGFLGEINLQNQTNLFVNLRCMQVITKDFKTKSETKMTAIIYVGCGITAASIAQKEWEESCNKAQTMKQILEL